MAKLFVVGIGPGDLKHMTCAAREALESAEVVAGYQTYLDFIEPLLCGKEVVSTGMTKEVERCQEALRIAASGKAVALVSGGDAGIYGMAGLVLELVGTGQFGAPEVVVIPGVSALQAAAAVLGAPLMHDHALISLSDLLTDWEAIKKRIECAAMGDFVICLYNPKSKTRTTQIEEARRIILKHRDRSTPVGIVREAMRTGQKKILATLESLPEHEIDMTTMVIIGNSRTYVSNGRMITPRGYLL
jgi:adenosylcobyric acid synthase